MHNIKSIQILTPLQEGLLFHALAKTDKQAYLEQYCFTMPGNIDVNHFGKCLETIIQRHDALRARFVADKGTRPLQVILDKVTPELTVHPAEEFETFLLQDRERSFDLLSDTLIRTAIFPAGDITKLVISFHHIILDGWSFAIVMNELISLYNGNTVLNEPVSFTSVMDYLSRQDPEEVTKYWLEHLAIEQDFHPRPLTESFMQPSINMEQLSRQLIFSEALTLQLKQAAAVLQVSINTILYGIWGILLSRYSRQKKVISGITVSGREIDISDAGSIVGMCINTIPFSFQVDDNVSLDEYFSNISFRFISSFPYQYCSLADIGRKAGIEGDLFDHIVAIEDYPFDESGLRDGKISGTDVFDRTSYPLSVHISAADKILWRISFNVDRYPEALIGQVLDHLNVIGSQVAEGISNNKRLSDIKIWGDTTTNNLIHSFNDTAGYYPAGKTLLSFYYELLEQHSAVSIEDEDHRLSIEDLENYSNAVQHALAEMGVNRGDTVAICIDRSVWLIVAIMGIFKRAGTYVPVDMRMPEDRIAYVLQDAGVKAVVGWGAPLVKTGAGYIDIQAVIREEHTDISPVIMPVAKDPAYIIYTSGSTGMPKGVVVEHSAVVNRVYWMQKDFPLSKEDCILQKTNSSFDVSVWELFHWLFSECTTFFLAQGKESDPYEIISTIKQQKVTVIHFVPSMLALFTDIIMHDHLAEDCTSLRFVFASGEALLYTAMLQFNECLYKQEGTILVNLYGPTEATVDCTGFTCSPWPGQYKYIPIGTPLLNTRAYIFDEQMALLPPWIAGELCIAGTGVAVGYIGKEQLTAEKFVPDPFTKRERMYKTGDLAMWNDVGELIYLGRTDQQVKLNGQRIEPGDIEAKLLSLDGIREAVVLLMKREQGASFLYAFYTGREIPALTIRTELARLLPAYMIPSGFKRIKDIPRLGSGKINRRQLSVLLKEQEAGEPLIRQLQDDPHLMGLLALWEQVIGKQVDPAKDFFANGGHSLTAIRMMAAIKRNFGIQISLPDILQYPTLDRLAAHIKKHHPSQAAAITTVPAPDTLALMPSQESIYVLETLPDIGFTYYVPALVRLEDKPDEQMLMQATGKLLEKYTVLCTRFTEKNEGIFQEILPAGQVYEAFIRSGGIKTVSLPGESPLEAFGKQRVRIDITQAPLFRLYLLQHNNVHYLLMDIHHLITDEHSNTVFVSDLLQLYKQMPTQLPALQFHDVALWYHNIYLKGEQYQQDKSWWGNYLKQLPASPILPAVKDNNNSPFEGTVLNPALPPALVHRIRSLSSTLGVTDFSVIFSAFHIILSGYTENNSLLCGVPFSNRMTDEMQDVTGFMVSTLPFHVRIDPALSFSEYVHRTGRQLAEVMEHSWYPLSHLLRDKKLSRYGHKHPLFNIFFNYVVADPETAKYEDVNPAPESGARFDLSIEITELGNTFSISFIHAANLVDAGLSAHLYNAFCSLMMLPDITERAIAGLQLLVPPMGTDNGTVVQDTIPVMQVPAEITEKTALIFKEVLGLSTISPEDDFFLSGGQSLSAIKLVNRIKELFRINISLHDVFRNPQLHALASFVASQQKDTKQLILHTGEQPYYSLSPLQRRLWFIQQREPDNISYNMTTAFKVSMALEQDILEECFAILVQRHDQLRASFLLQEDGPVVQLATPASYLTFLSGERSVAEIMELANVFSNTPFRLDQAPLFRVLIMDGDAGHFYLVINLHHIIADGWSISVMLSELLSLYKSKLAAQPATLVPLPLRYVDIAKWMSTRDTTVSSQYWLNKITSAVQYSVFPYIAEYDTNEGATLHHALPEELSLRVLQLAKALKVTDFQLMMFSFALLQTSVSGSNHFIIGSSVSGRTHTSMESVIGFFVNMLPVLVNIDKQRTVRDALSRFSNGIKEDMEYVDLSFDELSALVRKEKGINLPEYISTRFVYNNFSAEENSMDAEEIEVIMDGSKFDLSFTVQPYKKGLSLNVEYKTGKYTKAVIIAYIKQWEMMLEQVCEHPEEQIEQLLSHSLEDAAVRLKVKSHELLKSMKK